MLQNSIICAFESKQCTDIMSSVKKKQKQKQNKTKQNKTFINSVIEKKLICTIFGNALSLCVIILIPQRLNLSSF